MNPQEISLVDLMQKSGEEHSGILSKLRANRAKNGETGPSSTALYDHMGGETYVRGAEEARGFQVTVSNGSAGQNTAYPILSKLSLA